jgi:DNA polymerase-4
MNNFYASVECSLDLSLKDKCIAVCGSTEERHGIVLAKNYAAKAYGVQTAEATWQAKQKCPQLVIVPPHYDAYMKYSKLARNIYQRYTDRIEPYGMDEAWLDVTGSTRLFGSGEAIANEIREAVKFELGLTVSCGVSFNKVFAKLGSDMKKPDAVTCIPQESFQGKIWHLPVGDLIGVGRATQKTLAKYAIYTIGELANADPKLLSYDLKSYAYQLTRFAKGQDDSVVLHQDFTMPAKSVGHGITTIQDLENNAEVWKVILELTQDIGRKLRAYGKKAKALSIHIKDKHLISKGWQCQIPTPSQSASYLAKEAYDLFQRSYDWYAPIRSVTVSAMKLVEENTPIQLNLFVDSTQEEKLAKLDDCIHQIRERFGENAIRNSTLLHHLKIHPYENTVKMPTGMVTLLEKGVKSDEPKSIRPNHPTP